jgi:hypothetical protein
MIVFRYILAVIVYAFGVTFLFDLIWGALFGKMPIIDFILGE